MQKEILEALKMADFAAGFTLRLDGKATEPMQSISIRPDATGFQTAIEFDNGTFIPAEILNAATINGTEITLPGRAKFTLYRRVPIQILPDRRVDTDRRTYPKTNKP